MAKPKFEGPMSGFPEVLPEVRRVEQQWLDTIRQVFETYGFASVETAAVEQVSTLAAKGEDADKEIYALRRLQGDSADDPKLAMHFDLTVPFARYVAQNYNDLTFPFKRYQIQKCWRGERPQEGRYREFAQCDIDVVDNNEISIQFDTEMPRVVHKILSKLGVDDIQTNINNRKIIQGYYQGLGIEDPMEAIRIIDKIDKIGKKGVAELLNSRMSLKEDVINKCLELADIKTPDSSFVEKVHSLGVQSDLMEEGLTELKFVMDNLSDLPEGAIVANMSIARGLDYYTGTVFEGKFVNYPNFPTIYAGGRYENLVGTYLNKKLPGVGISIGLTRMLLKLYKENRLAIAEKSPTDVLMINFPDSDYKQLSQKAEILRDNQVNVEIYHNNSKKIGEQIKYANKKGIRYILMASESQDEVKDLFDSQQNVIDIEQWLPDRSNSTQTTIVPSAKRNVLKFNE